MQQMSFFFWQCVFHTDAIADKRGTDGFRMTLLGFHLKRSTPLQLQIGKNCDADRLLLWQQLIKTKHSVLGEKKEKEPLQTVRVITHNLLFLFLEKKKHNTFLKKQLYSPVGKNCWCVRACTLACRNRDGGDGEVQGAGADGTEHHRRGENCCSHPHKRAAQQVRRTAWRVSASSSRGVGALITRSLFLSLFLRLPPRRPFLDMVYSALDCTADDYHALFVLCLLYAVSHSKGRLPVPSACRFLLNSCVMFL